MKKNKPKNQNIFQSVADRLSRFFGKEETPEPKQEEPSGNDAEAAKAEPETPPTPVRVRRSRVKISRPKPRSGEKERKVKVEENPSIYELPYDMKGPAIRDFVLAHLSDENLSVETMAAKLKVSRTSLYTLMRSEFGVTPAEFILDHRLKHAEKLLKDGLKVREVAMKCGFADPKYFSKVFKKYYGILPSTYNA